MEISCPSVTSLKTSGAFSVGDIENRYASTTPVIPVIPWCVRSVFCCGGDFFSRCVRGRDDGGGAPRCNDGFSNFEMGRKFPKVTGTRGRLFKFFFAKLEFLAGVLCVYQVSGNRINLCRWKYHLRRAVVGVFMKPLIYRGKSRRGHIFVRDGDATLEPLLTNVGYLQGKCGSDTPV